MRTVSFELTEQQDAVIQALLQSGRFQDADEIFREGLHLLEQREAQDAAKLTALREAIAEGLADIERGDYVEFDSVEDLSAFLDQLAEDALREAASQTGG